MRPTCSQRDAAIRFTPPLDGILTECESDPDHAPRHRTRMERAPVDRALAPLRIGQCDLSRKTLLTLERKNSDIKKSLYKSNT